MERLWKEKTFLGETPFSAKYEADFERYFDVILREQLLDKELWALLERQFDCKWDGVDSGWRGEYWGKLMRGACLIYAHVQRADLYEILTTSVKAMLGKIEDCGRISSYEQSVEYNGWDMWARKYVMLGMEFYYDICKDEGLKRELVRALEQQADYIVQTVGEEAGKKPISKTSRNWGTINSVSILQPFVILNNICPKESYAQFIQMLLTVQSMENFNIFEYFKNETLAPYQYPIVKAYEMISCAEGLLDLANATGNQAYVDICTRFADKILQTDFTLIGGIGCCDEMFDNSTKKQVVYSEVHKQETCVVVTLSKFLYSLYLVTGKTAYIDGIERALFNAYLGALNDDVYCGNLVRPLFYSYSPILDNPRWDIIGGARNISSFAGFGCCIAIGAAGLGLIPKLGVMGNADGLTLNLFMCGEYTLSGKNGETTIVIDSNYPQDGKIKLTVESCQAEGSILRIRDPYWATGATLFVNGKRAAYEKKEGYLVLTARVRQGDEVYIDFETPVVVTESTSVNEDVKGLFALSKCALVYAIDSRKGDLNTRYDVEEVKAAEKVLTEKGLLLKLPSGEVELEQYRNCGKNYYHKPVISVWLKTTDFKGDTTE